MIYQWQVTGPVASNLVAVILPWVEAIAGVMLIAGLWRRESAAVVALMLVVFLGAAIAQRADGSLVDPPAQKEGGKWPKSPTELASDMKAPVLGLYGEADQGIPVAQVEAMKEALAKAKKKAEFKLYPGAPHGFHADYRPSYRKEAAEDAWKMALDFLKKNKVL